MAAASTTRKTPAKRPPVADRKPKQVAAAQKAEATGTVVTVKVRDRDWSLLQSGIEDYEFIEEFGAAMSGNPFAMPSAMKRLLGDEQYEAAKALLRDDTGYLDVRVVTDFFMEVFQAANPNS